MNGESVYEPSQGIQYTNAEAHYTVFSSNVTIKANWISQNKKY